MEILKMLKIAFAEHTMVKTQVFEWFSKFRSSVTSAADTKYSGHSMMSKTDEYIHQYQTISKNNLNMHWHATKFVPLTCSLCFVCVWVSGLQPPPYSPAIVLCHFSLSSKLTMMLKGRKLNGTTMTPKFCDFWNNTLDKMLQKLVQSLAVCVQYQGDYCED